MEKGNTRKLVLSMAITFDGFVAGPNNQNDWLVNDDENWDQMFKDLESVDTILVGRNMYPGYFEYWHNCLKDSSTPANLRKYAEIAEKIPHVIFSKTLKQTDWPNTRIATDLKEEVEKLKQQPGKEIRAWGGVTLASSLINLGLVDEYRFALSPTLLAGGKRLFDKLQERKKLKLISAKPTQAGNIIIKYATS